MAHPLRERLRGFAMVSELLGRDWARGRLMAMVNPPICFELSFEQIPFPKLPGTALTYLCVVQGKKTIFEFQCGKLVTSRTSEDDYARYVQPFIERLQSYDHSQASFDRAFDSVLHRR